MRNEKALGVIAAAGLLNCISAASAQTPYKNGSPPATAPVTLSGSVVNASN